MKELVYGPVSVKSAIREKHPQAKITDASDFIHESRFEVEIEGVEPLDFYKFAFENDFLDSCFAFVLMTYRATTDQKEMLNTLLAWIREQEKRA